MKKLPLHKRPYFAKRILEVGGGHNPYVGVTHAVDKFPHDNTQRGDDLLVLESVEFRQGDLEEIPFTGNQEFDFLYASHVFEHLIHPEKAVSEINRVAKRGYIETPSPLREQIACPIPFDEAGDFHTLFCWSGKDSNEIHVIKKTAQRLGEFCSCRFGKAAQSLFRLAREEKIDLEPLMPGVSKETRVYFHRPLTLVLHGDFKSACEGGACAYESVRYVRTYSTFPGILLAKRFRVLRNTLGSRWVSEMFHRVDVSN